MDRKKELTRQITALQKELDKILEEERKEKDFGEFENDLQIQVIGESVIILRGGTRSLNTKTFMDKAVSYVVDTLGRDKDYTIHEFIKSSLDNPWVRVLLINASSFEFADGFDDIAKKIKV